MTQQGSTSGGGFTFSKFFEGLTFNKLTSLVIAVMLAYGAIWNVKTDIPPNKAAESQAYYKNLNEQEKTKQEEIRASVARLNSSQKSQERVANACVPISDVSAGKGYLIARGECLSLPLAQYFIYTASESPVVSVTGADFIVTTNDESASCDSTQTNDRCGVWLTQHQTLGGSDESIYRKPRYWMSFKSKGDISIQTGA